MRLLLTILSLAFSIVAFGQSQSNKKLRKQVDDFIAENLKNFAPGCQVLVARKDEIIYEKAFGLANLELRTAMEPGMVLRIGSITKQFTAAAILQLVDKGQISLSDSIQKFISNFNTQGKTVTVENLLTHTSGIRGYEQLDAKVPNAIRVDFPAKTVIDSLAKLPLAFEPNTKYEYSNSNYFLLGYILEKVSGQSYPDYLKDHILDPAGLASTFYDNPTQLIPNRANGYAFSNGIYWNAGYISMSLVYSAGALLSSAGNLYKWHKALYSGKIIRKETLLKAVTPFKLADGTQSGYGYGFFVRNEKGLRSVGHGGAIDGFRSTAVYYPDQDVYISCLLNSDQDNESLFFQGIANLIPGMKPDLNIPEIKLSDDILDKYVGTYKNDRHNVRIRIFRANSRIYGELSNGTGSHLQFLALTETRFVLPDIKRIKTTAEFISENGKATRLVMTQEEPVEFMRIE